MIDLMSPAGSYETLMTAINSGAKSIYFGLGKLNMRAKSSVNFTEKDLKEIVRICKENNVRTYLAVNTVMYDNDLEEMRKIIRLAKEEGVSAIIASDAAVLQYALEQKVEIHASTQLNISNIEAVKFYAQFCDIMVLAREVSLDKIAKITEQIKEQDIRGPKGELVKIEIFIHGALCMAISGKCYLSLHEYNMAANKGACLQICRRGYTVKDKETQREFDIENEYIMSPKDLCTVGFIDKIIKAGVSVMKIEGRARPPEYVKTVTEVYSQAIKAVEDGTYCKEKIDAWKERLSEVFNRGFWDGYYLGQKLGEWNDSYGSKAKFHKEFVASVNNYFSRLGVMEVYINTGKGLKVGDTIYVIGNATGTNEMTIKEIRDEDNNINLAQKGMVVSIPCDFKVRKTDKIYLKVENEF